MNSDNQKTLLSYSQKATQYIQTTRPKIDGEYAAWIDKICSNLTASPKILEVGAGHGIGSIYLKTKGYAVDTTDAVPEFVEYLSSQGLKTSKLDLITDEIKPGYDLILALAVFLHFTAEELKNILQKIYVGLNTGGILAFSTKQGNGQEWSSHKLDAPRFFKYWEYLPLQMLLDSTGFEVIDHSVSGQSAHGEPWLQVIARKK